MIKDYQNKLRLINDWIDKKGIPPSVSKPENTPSVSKESKMRDSTKIKYDSYMDFFEKRRKKGDNYDSAMSKTLEKFKISNDTFDKAFRYYKSLKNN
jgi:hypothetical protein